MGNKAKAVEVNQNTTDIGNRANGNEDLLPSDEGRIAYQSRQTPDSNPYGESDWRHEEWWFGWKTEEECDQDEAYEWSTDSFK